MSVSTAQNLHNRGTFYAADTALKSGNSSRDRQSGSDMTYMPYQQGDQLSFQATAPLVMQETSSSAAMMWVYRLLNLDLKLVTAVVMSLCFGSLLQALLGNPIMTLLLSPCFFCVWYVMSYFDFQRAYHNALNGPRQARYHRPVSVSF